MPPFPRQPGTFAQLDWQLFADGPAVLYHSTELLAQHCAWLSGKGYQVVRFDCLGWSDSFHMHADLKGKLGFPDYYGHNLDALDECMDVDLDEGAALGFVLAFRDFDSFNAKDARTAWHLLDIVARASRSRALMGSRLLALVHTVNPRFTLEPFGACDLRPSREDRLHQW